FAEILCTPKDYLRCAVSLLKDKAYLWWDTLSMMYACNIVSTEEEMCIIFEDGLNDEIQLAVVLPVENKEEVPMRLPTTLIVAGDEILTGKTTGRSCPTVSLDLLVVLSVERVELIVTSDKTINARVANVEIYNGASITVQFVKNVIIHGLKIHHNFPPRVARSRMVKTTMGHGVPATEHCADGLIDVIQGSTTVTISNCHFTDHN
ncbi:hypothetical protein Goari_010176, partial [Gossypium aridum]|nr:hypothetical protein [Gossypium aridum]